MHIYPLSCRGRTIYDYHINTHHLWLPICICVKRKQKPKTIRVPSNFFQYFPPILVDKFLAYICHFLVTCLESSQGIDTTIPLRSYILSLHNA